MMDFWQYAFMQRALIGGVIVGLLTAIIGVYVVLKGMSFIGAGVAHASFGGVALGFLLGIDPLWAAVAFCLAVAWGIGTVTRRGGIKEDTAVGIFFASTMAFGVLLIGLIQGYNIDLFSYLFGSILAITAEDLKMVLGVGFLVLLTVALLYKEFLFITFDPETARVSGLPEPALYYLLLALIALTVVVSIKVVGIVLVSALLVTPAASAYQLSRSFGKMMALSAFFGVLSVVVGLILSYYLNTASGATVVLTATAIFGLTLLWRRWREAV
ncbi:MAG: metal ABC transporter permease [Chloroflexi bacterium]|nr:metal ABC transporter permease [Chloroflexota bacterium]